MSQAAQRILADFEALPESDQRAVTEEILRRSIELDGDLFAEAAAEADEFFLTQDQREEIDRRLAEHDRNPGSAIPWEEVQARLDRRFA
jgi:putative addiction module component (TIGR02574 family)